MENNVKIAKKKKKKSYVSVTTLMSMAWMLQLKESGR